MGLFFPWWSHLTLSIDLDTMQYPVLNALLAIASANAFVNPGPGFSNHHVESNGTTWPWQVYKSSPLTPPNLTITTNGKPLAPGLVFFEPADFSDTPAVKQSGGYAFTDKNELVFAQPVAGLTDFRVQVYNGKPYITYWSGYNTLGGNIGHGYGNVTFLDQNYEIAFVVCPDLNLDTQVTPTPQCQIDIHEHQLTPRNTIIVSAYNATPTDLTSVNRSANGWIQNCLFYEIDIPTNKVLFEWSAIDHVSVTESHLPVGNATETAPWDYFHVNSVELVDDIYIVNGRHTWTTYFVSAKNGSVLYRLNGETGGDFGALPPNGTFRWQHHVRRHNSTADGSFALSLFDNHNYAGSNGTAPTKGLVFGLRIPPNKAQPPTVQRHLEISSQEIYADSQGSYQADIPGSGGHQFMGYGQISTLREYGPAVDGSDLRWEAQFGTPNLVQSYRGFKQEWHAVPKAWDPSLVLENGKGYVSWNGATDVYAWLIFEGSSKDNLRFAGRVPFRGFETGFNVPTTGCVQVAAVGREIGAAKGQECELRRSAVVCCA